MAGNTNLPRVGDGELQRLTGVIESAINVLERNQLNNVTVLAPQLIGAADTRVCHGLGRAVQGYWIVRCTGDVRVCDGLVPETIDPANYFTLRASSANTVTLAVF